MLSLFSLHKYYFIFQDQFNKLLEQVEESKKQFSQDDKNKDKS